jgi:hypothetical protein
MLKLILLTVAMIALAHAAALPGGIVEQGQNEEVMEIAKWTTDKMSQFSGVEGDHTVMSIRNVRTQVVAGKNYYLTIDYLIAGPENKYFFKSCDVVVFDQSWTNTRKFLSNPTCGSNPNYPNKRQMTGGWTESSMSQTVSDLATWSHASLAQFSGVDGEQTFTTLSIRNIKTQVVSGTNYWFDLDLLVAGSDNKYYFKSCNIKINYVPWTNTRTFIEEPKCAAHPNYPNSI